MYPVGSEVIFFDPISAVFSCAKCVITFFIQRLATLNQHQSFDKYLENVLGTEARHGKSCTLNVK